MSDQSYPNPANHLKTQEGAKAYVLESVSLIDWKARTQHILELHGYRVPEWWMNLLTTDSELIRKQTELKLLQEQDNFWRRR